VLDEADREVRLHGKFRYLSGRVWKAWDRHVHTISRKRWIGGEKGVLVDGQPPSHWPRMMLLDPHDEKPHAVLWVAKEPEYQLYYCYREAWLKDRTFAQACEEIRDQEVGNRDKVLLRVMDPNFGPKTQGNTKTTVRDDFEVESKNIGFPMRFAYGDDHKAMGRTKVAEMLWYDTKFPISAINQPALYVCDDLAMCIYQIEHYIWPDRDESKPDPMIERPVNKHSDFPDLLQYMSLNNWTSEPPEIIQGVGNSYA